MNNKNLICPECGTTFQVDAATYDSIASQVRNSEFEKEVSKYKAELDYRFDNAVKIAEVQKESAMKDIIATKDAEIRGLNNHINDTKAQLFNSEQTVIALRKDLENFENLKNQAVTLAISKEREATNQKDIELSLLKHQLINKDDECKMKIEQTAIEYQKQIAELEKQIAINNSSYVAQKDAFQAQYDSVIKSKDEEIAFYRDLKSKQSVKMLGETLEEHCKVAFEEIRPLMPGCYFEKDNEISEAGTKGDFIFRDYFDNEEITSIMFDMKNEADLSTHKHKNEDHLKKLDKDRREKGCEYAVLVSTLEPESEFYNRGIVSVSHKYPKMFVVRPQFFVLMIILLRTAALETVSYKKELKEFKNQQLDITNFEENLDAFKEAIFKSAVAACKKKESSVEKIDRIIGILNQIKEDLRLFDQYMEACHKKAEPVTVKRLAKNSPSLIKMFEENNQDTQIETAAS